MWVEEAAEMKTSKMIFFLSFVCHMRNENDTKFIAQLKSFIIL